MMNKISMSSFFLFLLFLVEYSQANAKLAPALYIFGDSSVDAGNNNFLHTKAKANIFPYGIDHPLGTTGRFTNGLTMPDFIAQWLGLRFQPPVMDPNVQPDEILEGLNYGSGSAGTLNETGKSQGGNLSMRQQVNLFNKTVQEHLPLQFKSEAELADYLSKSIFIVSIGSNDYMLNYYNPMSDLSHQYTREQFADLLVNEFGNCLKDLYRLGARKFVVSQIAALGCIPVVMNKYNTSCGCVDEKNLDVSSYNLKLANELKELGSTLNASTFVLAKGYDLTNDLVTTPAKNGFSDARNPCVAINGTICQDRNSHAFWDLAHPTEATYKTFATRCFNGTDMCVPMNIQELVNC